MVPNLQEESWKALRLVHSSMVAQECSVADFVISEELLKSCAHASNRYKLYLVEKSAEKGETEKTRKRKVLKEELAGAKKRKLELEAVMKRLVGTANKKAKEAEKKTEAVAMKSLLMESNAAREKSEDLQKDIADQEKEIVDIEQKIKHTE